MPSEAQKRADRKYKKGKTQQLCLRFYPGETEMWTFLSAQENKQGFLKKLICKEMEAMSNGQSQSTSYLAEVRRNKCNSRERNASDECFSYNDRLD